MTSIQSTFIFCNPQVKTLFAALGILFSSLCASSQEKNEFTPSMGLGLCGISYWGTNFPILNLMKQAAGGTMLPSVAGNNPILFDEMASRGLIDKNGWPTSLPKGYYWHSIVTADAGIIPSQRGEYLVRYRGDGELRLVTNGRILSQSPGEFRLNLSQEEHYLEIQILQTDPKKVGDYIRDIEIVKAEHIALHEAGLLFNPQWLALIQDMRVVRFMDWQFTNGNIEKHWQERPRLSDNAWAVTLQRKSHKGVPIEAMVALANHIGADPWFNIPFHADDEYISQFSRYVAQHLDPQLIPYFEYSNEVWNWIFPQTRDSANAGQKILGNAFGESTEREYYGYRSAQMSDIIRKEFKTLKRPAPHVTLGTQTDDNDHPLTRAFDGAQHYLAPTKRSLNAVFDSVAVTWYFGIEPHLQGQIVEWINKHGKNRAQEMVFEQFLGKQQHFEVTVPADAPSIEKMLHNIRIQSTLAQKYGLDVISYEGGTHLMGYESYNEPLAEFFMEINDDPRMADIYRIIEKGWRKIPGTTLLNHFVEVSNHSKWGSWGALQHLEDDTARWDFLVESNKRDGTWEARSPQAFSRGLINLGDGKKNTLTGTFRSDYLVGFDDHDTLKGGAGDDGLHGGDGNDTLYGEIGDDILVPGVGQDELYGGPGKDTFRLTFPIGNQVNTVHDFDSQDQIDLRPLFLNVPKTPDISRFITSKVVQDDTQIHVDLSGSGADFSHVLTLKNTKSVDVANLIKAGRILLH